MLYRISFCLSLFSLFLYSCKLQNVPPKTSSLLTPVKSIDVPNAAVVTAHPEATKIGFDILKQGGNAIDAAIAVQFALAVCYPVAGNIGGGGFMIYRDKAGNVEALDFREKAPGRAFPDMYLDENGQVIDGLSRKGHLAAGVPGTVDGMVKAFEKYSQLNDWAALVQPAVDLATEGFPITARQAELFTTYMQDFTEANTQENAFTAKETWRKGDLLIQKSLGQTLASIRDKREDGFYKGWVAEAIVAEMDRGNGIISLDDLANYESVWRKPVVGEYRGLRIYSMPPPSSGGLILLQLLKMIEPFPMTDYGFQSTQAVHLMVEAERRAYADRATHLGDPDFYPVPTVALLDEAYIRDRMTSFDPSSASKSEDIAAGDFGESEETTHFSIVDKDRNAVSLTTTINTAYGSKVVVGEAGFFLNNEMDDFSAKPGVPNYFGLVGAEANKIESGKRMLSSMTPTIVEKDGDLKLVVGTPGGSTIITSVFQVMVNIFDFGQTATEAVHNPRFHHQWKPDVLFIEDDCLQVGTQDSLRYMGHELKLRGKIGKVEAILVRDTGSLEAVADSRADDHAMGY